MKKLWVLTLLLPILLILCVNAQAAEPATPGAIEPAYSWYTHDYTVDADTNTKIYTIKTVKDLAGLAKITQNNVTLADSTTITKSDFSGEVVKLGDNLTFGDNQYWYYNNNAGTVHDYRIMNFAGTFDGNDKTITGLKFHNDARTHLTMSLIQSITATGCVKDLTCDTVNFTLNNSTNYHNGQNYAASIACTMYGSAENCHVKNVTITSNGYVGSSGGMFGSISGGAEVKDSTVESVSITITSNDNGQYVGGFAGLIAGTDATTRVSISNCSVENVTFDCSYKLKRFGGFVGYSYNTILTDCTAMNINYDVDDYVYVTGGFVGMAGQSSDFNNCDVHGVTMKLSRKTAGATRVGGFGGTVSNGKEGTTCSFVDCDVTGLDITMDGKVQSDIGGFLGYSDAPAYIDKCTASGTIDATNTSDDSEAVGGFIGSTTKGTTIKNSSADVDVKANVDAGGFAGDASNLTIENSKALGDVASTNGAAGGFAGVSNGNTSLKGCESTGSVTSTSGAAGGLVGYVPHGTNNITFGENCVPSTSVSGVVTNEVVNSTDKAYSDVAHSKNCQCYVTIASYQIGYPTIQDAVDAGAVSVTLLVDLDLGAPTKNGYKFDGWYKDNTFAGEVVTRGTTDTTYYPKWTAVYVPSTDKLAFDQLKVGYTTVTSKDITFTFLGKNPGITSAVSDAADDTAFVTAIDELKVTVTPKTGLGRGEYTETLTITTGDNSTHQVTVTLTVARRGGGGGGGSSTKLESPKTFDGGIAVYGVMALSSALGAAYVTRKK